MRRATSLRCIPIAAGALGGSRHKVGPAEDWRGDRLGKPGTWLISGAERAGRVTVVDIGVPDSLHVAVGASSDLLADAHAVSIGSETENGEQHQVFKLAKRFALRHRFYMLEEMRRSVKRIRVSPSLAPSTPLTSPTHPDCRKPLDLPTPKSRRDFQGSALAPYRSAFTFTVCCTGFDCVL